MKTDCDSEEVVMTENKDECSESWIQAMNSTEQMMIESISPPLLSLVTSDADLTIEETESPTNGKARELSLRMSGRASRQEDEIVQQQQAQLTETPVDEKTREENKERPATIMVDNESRTNTKSATMVVTDDEAGKSKRAKCDLSIKKTGVRFGNLKPISTDKDLDPPPFNTIQPWFG
uniref:PH domain-containing protein n=1 Tax=Trichogramma kaykai TaxID=54128 RepID=A0ABD2WCH8_9HYME